MRVVGHSGMEAALALAKSELDRLVDTRSNKVTLSVRDPSYPSYLLKFRLYMRSNRVDMPPIHHDTCAPLQMMYCLFYPLSFVFPHGITLGASK